VQFAQPAKTATQLAQKLRLAISKSPLAAFASPASNFASVEGDEG
jgi:hypothetical protein